MTLVSEQRDSEIGELKARVAVLEEQVAHLEENSAGRVIVLREITKEEARREIVDLFAAEDILYYSDISERLSIDLETVVEICRELKAEGAIRVDDDPV